MTQQHLQNRIALSGDELIDKSHIVGTQITVEHVLKLLTTGRTVSEIVSEDCHPDLTIEDVLACVSYASYQNQLDTPNDG